MSTNADDFDEGIEKVSRVTGAIGQMIQIAGDNPDTRKAGQSLARSAATVAQLVENTLLPIAAVNFGFKKAKEYFESRFSEDMSQKISNIPPDKIVEPPASVVAPALQGLGFSNEEPSLKEMYLNLLASAMDGRTPDKAHPAFSEIIRQLNATEAGFLKLYLPYGMSPIAKLSRKIDNNGAKLRYVHCIMVYDKHSGSAVLIPQFPQYIDNWIRLGLIDVDYGTWLTADHAYDWVKSRPEYISLLNEVGDENMIQITKGLLRTTDFGKAFVSAVF
ncbi:DUF4393 domain-containing protein [Paracoccus sp. M683]|uniref:DUF4393 domain-containing protein n=1 Tax=Paracoccus sp. M683 TaxID=2594268 RepID=UPI00117E54E5|nr:DUF4393 domain-containing protein [Paracoccus sp. M683]TRW98426.1 DUF4393 domain-containing protein [Paracoccus sp. M683]